MKKLLLTEKQINIIKENINRELTGDEIKILHRVFDSKGSHYDWAKKIGLNPNHSRKDSVMSALRNYHGGINKILDQIEGEISGEVTLSEGDYIITFEPDDLYVESDDEVNYNFFVNGDKTFFMYNNKKYPFNADGLKEMEKEFGDEFVNDVIGHEVESIISNYLYKKYTLIYGIEFYTTFSELKYNTNFINESNNKLNPQQKKLLLRVFKKKGIEFKWSGLIGLDHTYKDEIYQLIRILTNGKKTVGDLIYNDEMKKTQNYICGNYSIDFIVDVIDDSIDDEFIRLEIDVLETSHVELYNGHHYYLSDDGFDKMEDNEDLHVLTDVVYEINDCLITYFEEKYLNKYGVYFDISLNIDKWI